MKGLFSLSILAVALFLGPNSCSGRVPLNPFPLGTIGCLVSDVCGSGEVCANDNLFGSCQNVFTRALIGEPKFKLETEEIERLGLAIQLLIKAGFTWKDAFTQCTLQNTLVEFAHQRVFNPNLCKDALSLSSDEVSDTINEEVAAVLLQLLENGDLQLMDGAEEEAQENPEFDGFNSHKRDEIVQVHKYFDKSKGQLKRDMYEGMQNDSPYQYLYPSINENDEENIDNTGYLEPSPAYNSDSEDGEYPVFSTGDTESDDAILKPEEESMPVPTLEDLEASTLRNADLETAVEDGDSDFSLSPEDEETLELLLKGDIQPSDLSGDQQVRLQHVIEGLINLLDQRASSMESVSPSSFQEQEDSYLPDLSNDEDLTMPPQFDEAAMNQNGDDNGDDLVEEDKRVKTKYSEPSQSSDDGVKDTVEFQALKEPTDDGEEADSDENKSPAEEERGPIDTHSMYMQLSQDVDTRTGLEFVEALAKILKLEPGTIGFVEVGPDNLVNLEVNTNPAGEWDAEKIAKEALKVKEDLIKETGGIFVIRAGIGREDNGVEVKESNRNIVLTFILVGSIAGVVLAVLTIYFIKRHAKFKQKLAQMASNPDGNEASKDYQDLCRQRMQGKTSEKPEPLHAASRIGSVSESQVRSPSSRSSTSSWSEEPAATNMDISTGHIVLSYMEDHLKNQDRLDKEWEAVSGYSADPSSTKMSTDQSNTRKNRFADILPYDHSRVVLSSNANVANSDYINANFITDHDPRNPAYICTQGPLPHTVADFWQMIWEQGSVVIVMLTKLAENGTSLCHRYWPEEGSDLYHIYEVHLVSEHIWCDDYLVRSFYLKNLQTNETRTVTQFHFLTWPQLSVPASIKALLDFRRKVNKSFRGRSCPIVVHCSDGCGRSGTYCLIDMVLNKMAKGAKEIDMAATLEHIRDQRMSMVKTKEQFQFSLAAVAEEVHAILKALPQ